MKKQFESVRNKKAYFDYEILDSYEAGVILLGEEVKSIRQGGMNFTGGYILFKGDIPYIIGINIHRYKHSSNPHYNPTRDRKLLLKQQEIDQMRNALQAKGVTLLPLEGYFKHNLFKIRIGLGKGKKKFDKREAIKKREEERENRKFKL